jgi:hypothetical protein
MTGAKTSLTLLQPMIEAGTYLAGQAREECMACVAGIHQYAAAYPSCWARAKEIEAIYKDKSSVRRGRQKATRAATSVDASSTHAHPNGGGLSVSGSHGTLG